MKIRKAELTDLPEIMRLEKEIFKVDPFSRRAYRYLIKKGWVFIIYYRKNIAGVGCILKNRLSGGYVKGRIYSVGTLEQFRGKGIASALIRYMEGAMGYVNFITLETHKHHESVIRLYQKLGYTKTEDLPDYYSDGEGIRMKKIVYEHLPNINYKTIPQNRMRYKDAGDWFDSKDGWEIRVPELMNMDYEFMIFIHEAIERYLVHKIGMSVDYVDGWIKREIIDKNDYGSGAMNKGMPHRSCHIFATQIEKQICRKLGISWRKYSKDVDGYVDDLYKREKK